MRNLTIWILNTLLCFAIFVQPTTTFAEEFPANDPVDIDELKYIPVFHQGRVKPFDSFTRLTMGFITDRQNKSTVTLDISDYIDSGESLESSDLAAAAAIFPDGKPRKFEAAEIVLSWLAEPDRWETVPFIYAAHEDLRDLIGVNVRNDRNTRLKYVSPAQIVASDELLEYFRELTDKQRAAASKGEELDDDETEEEKRVRKLMNRYILFRSLTLDPQQPLTFIDVPIKGSRKMFLRKISEVLAILSEENTKKLDFEEQLRNALAKLRDEHGSSNDDLMVIAAPAVQTLRAVEGLQHIGQRLFAQQVDVFEEGSSLSEIDATEMRFDIVRQVVAAFEEETGRLHRVLRDEMDEIFDSESDDETLRLFRELASKSKRLHRAAQHMHVTLYDEGDYSSPQPKHHFGSLLIAPAIDTPALAQNRDGAEDRKNKLQPWLNLQAILHSDELTGLREVPFSVWMVPLSVYYYQDYPREKVVAVREAWHELATSYVDREDPNREENCVAAQKRFATVLRDLGESIEPRRRRTAKETLTKEEYDEDILGYTEYPSHSRMSTEVHYNNLAPFNKSWVICLLGLFCYALAFGKARKPLFWAGTGMMVLGILWSAYGFFLRVSVTQWAPVTTMWETVIFVPFIVSLLGVWFLLVPMLWPGLRDAWRMSANPLIWEAKPLTDRQQAKLPAGIWGLGGWIATLLRTGMMAFILYNLSINTGYADGAQVIIPLTPSGGFTANGVMVWGMGLVCLLGAMWFIPRLVLTLALAIVFVPWNWRAGDQSTKMLADTYSRKWFGFAAALVATGFYMIASLVRLDGFDQNFSPLQPVLRSNFWLTIHVMTIVASYGAGLLAWGLGLAGLTFCLFGRYRQPVIRRNLEKGLAPATEAAAAKSMRRRPPEESVTLANYAYRAIQVAVLLLAVGTILGGLWADVSWGRFWGWDPKEVWALISLLVYLIILHGRFAGWFNNFGLLAGTVAGFTAIAFSWYGVNFILPEFAGSGSVGLHSYGSGSGGLWYVIGFGIANLIYLGIVTTRYIAETSRDAEAVEVEDAPIAAQLVEAKPTS